MAEEPPVRSPCVSICALDEDDICTGCYRNVREIADWSDLNNPERLEVLKLADERYRQRYGAL